MMTPPSPVIVAFTRHAERRILERGIDLRHISDLVLSHHDQRRRNPGDADWLIRAQGVAVAYNWPDGDNNITALVISACAE